MELDAKALEDVVTRLRKVEGQVAGIIRMVENGRECRDVVGQISAASTALDRAGFRLLASGLSHCVTNPAAAEASGYTQEELERLFVKLA